MTKIIGLTGGIGSGKSTVARLLCTFGAVVIDADQLAHEVYQPGTTAWKEIVAAFGRRVLTPEGGINRSVLGGIVFRDKASLNKLNAITHPRILQKLQKLIEKYRKQNALVVVMEVPLLIEVGWHKLVDEVWVITAPKAKIVEWLGEQRSLSEDEIASRAKPRLSETELIKHADVMLRNDGSREQLKKQVAEHWARLTINRD